MTTQRQYIRERLAGGNPLRKDLLQQETDILLLDIGKRYGQVTSLIRRMNDVIRYVRDRAASMPEFIKPYGKNIFIKVKVQAEGTRYLDKSVHPPNFFLRNKNVHQRISICGKRADGAMEDIILIPFMFGCEWCITSGATEKQLHAMGEDANYTGGFFVKGGSPKYFLAHEKVCHNLVIVLQTSPGIFAASLKTQDNQNKSIELIVSKDKKTGAYVLKSKSFLDDISFKVMDIIKQIYIILRRSKPDIQSFKSYVLDLIEFVAGPLKDFVGLDYNPIIAEGEEVFLKPNGDTMEKALDALFKDEDIKAAYTRGSHLNTIAHYPQVVIESILSSVKEYHDKAFILMKMLANLTLTEHGIIEPSDRDHLGNKSYLIAAEVFKRDLTMNNGQRLLITDDKIYEPKIKGRVGDSDVFEDLDITKPFKALSELTTLTTPRSSFASNLAVREVNGSQTGYVCPFHTPSGSRIGLVKHMSITCCVSPSHQREDIETIIISILGSKKFVKGETSILINSICFATATEEEIVRIRKTLKMHPRYYDTAFVPEFYLVRGEIAIISYNVMCDGGRLHRPLFNLDKLLEITEAMGGTGRTMTRRDKINEYIKDKSLEDLFRIGLVEMVFAVELGYYKIAETIESIDSSMSDRLRYVEINPVAIYGTNGGCAPMFNHNPGGRATHECSMTNPALTIGSTNMPSISETISKTLLTTEKAATTTLINEFNCGYYGNVVNAIMMIKIEEENIEDADVVSEGFSQIITTKRSNTTEVEIQQGMKIGIPPTIASHNRGKYHGINPETGFPILGSELKFNDCVFAMYKEPDESKQPKDKGGEGEEGEITNMSKFVERNKEGIISKIKSYPSGNSIIYRMTVSSYRPLEKGDKIASRYSQKGVVGGIIPNRKLPRVIETIREVEVENPDGTKSIVKKSFRTPNYGVRPDVIFSPMSLTSRSTPGVIIEMLLGLYATVTGQQVDATAFTVNIDRIKTIIDEMVTIHGFNPDLCETMLDPNTGRTFKAYIGVCGIRILEQTSYDKFKACSQITTSINKLTRQATQGGINGGLREGDMELHTMAAHSASSLVNQLYCNQSDKVNVAICPNCGHYNDKIGLCEVPVEDKECARCHHKSLKETRMAFGEIRQYLHSLTTGVRFAYYP